MKSTCLGNPVEPTFRPQRLRFVWVLAVPFLLISSPTGPTLLVGGFVSLLGLGVRAFASGSIHKEEELATGGPYRVVRHPLYLGSFLVGMGLAVASARWWILPIFLLLFVWIYGKTVRAEEEKLEKLFGEAYRQYRQEVPPFLPRIRPRPRRREGPGFRRWLYWRNREWQAALGTLLGYGLLWARMWFLA